MPLFRRSTTNTTGHRSRMILLRNTAIVLVALIAIIIGCYFSLRNYFTTCHEGFKSPTTYTATKTPYLINFDAVRHHDEVCSPEQIWMLVRHGTRTPSSKLIRQFNETLSKARDDIVVNRGEGRGSLCDTEFEKLKAWQPFHQDESEEKMLMPQGVKEMAGIASRYQKRFPNLFHKHYDNTTFYLKYTDTDRTKESADAFASGLFGDEVKNKIQYPKSEKADPILRFYKGCDKWQKTVNKNPETYKVQNLFAESQPFQDTLKDVSERLGFESTISKELLLSMYQNCAFETSYNPEKTSSWCSVLTETDFQVLEYYQDTDYYWVDGYGNEISYQSACPAVMDMIQHFDKRIQKNEDTPSVIAYFTHSGTLLKVLARLGLFHDKDPLRSDNFHSNANRQWKTSQIGTFGTNIAMVLYNCSSEYQVSLFARETEVPIPYCSGKPRCSFQEFRDEAIKLIGEKCENEKICQYNGNETQIS